MCLAAEQELAAHTLGTSSIVLRLAGIYGPGRLPRREEILAGTPIRALPDGFLNLIHVDDAAFAVLAAETAGQPARTYLVSDGHPVKRSDYHAELSRLLSAPPPVFDRPDDLDERQERSAGSKRISNARMLAELNVPLGYPSYREGLAAALNDS